MKNELTISVIIPTHNRCASLRRTIDALCAQTYSPQQVEVIVVADGCTDGTVEMLHHYRAPFALHIVEQLGQGAAGARNHGAARASGRMLLFLDDDIEATPSLIERHVHAHQRWPGHVVIGACPPVFEGHTGIFQMGLRQWWEDQFRAMRQSDHRYTYRDLLTGNLCLESGLFARVGGFDPTLRCREDYEFGLRVLKAGVSFTFAAGALAYHYETSDLDRSFQRIRQEGRADVQIGRRHPELRWSLPLAHLEVPCSRLRYVLRMFAFRQPRAGDALAARLRRALDLLEWARLRGRWQRLYRQLRDYWYWRGVAEQVGSRQALASFLQGGPIRPGDEGLEIELDLRQ
ncbi:MAG: glycosyltransferase family 2 protein, partial [Anaerolineae bacterium]